MGEGVFQQRWEEMYNGGSYLNRYPWDMIVSFIYRSYPKDKPRNEVKILEVGSGAGNNLWFAAREGFSIYGIDGSESAIQFARKRFMEENLPGEFSVGDFCRLPYKDNQFDIVIDRASITCCCYEDTKKIVSEVHRVLKSSGKFFFNPYSERHSSFVSGKTMENGLSDNISDGTLVGIGRLYFFNKRELFSLMAEGWKILSLEHSEIRDELNPRGTVHADWRVIAQKE